ncbi:MAG TPA: hypothetical protein VFH70_07585 [Acidimicrobiales bacterium]|nr:hypothetical protein [Acidimicrobiales bacterium]
MYRRPARSAARPVAKQRPDGPASPTRRRRWWPVAAVVVVVAVGAGVAWVSTRGGGGAGLGASVLPGAYEIVYMVETGANGPPVQTWEVLDATGPLAASDLTYHQDPRSGAGPVSGTVSTPQGLYDLSNGRLSLVSEREPGLASGPQALGAELPDLVRWGLAVDLHRSEALGGRACRLVRLSEPPAGPITAVSGGDHDDLCIDPAGLTLSEAWTYKGRVVLTRRAEEVELGATDSSIRGAPAPGPAVGGGAARSVITLGPVAGPSFLPSPSAPSGFAASAPVEVTADNPEQPGVLLFKAHEWVFVSGGRVVTVSAGEGAAPWDDSTVTTRPVSLAGLGRATEVLRSDGPEIQVQLPGDRWVRVRGTVGLPELVGYASSLAGPAATG